MNQIEKVSISGISFMLDMDAFEALNAYLSSLKAAYKDNPDGSEIIADIEARIAEIILSRQDSRTVVSKTLIDRIIAQLGMPEEAIEATRAASKGAEQTFPRRFYRNSEGAKLGGVCSGIATFFDIDPVWVRLSIFAPLVLLIFSAPLGFDWLSGFLGMTIAVFALLYFILWFSVPIAKTPRQKLEMRGERITASSIENNLRRELSSLGDSLQAQKSASVWSELFYTLGRIVLFCLKAIALIFTLGLALFGMALIVGIGAIFTVGASRFNFGNHDMDMFFQSISSITPEGYGAISMLLLLIPVFIIVWLLFCLIFDRPLRGRFFSIAGGIWVILAIYWGIVTVRELNEFDGRGVRIERTIVNGEVIEDIRIEPDSLSGDSLRSDTVRIIERETIKN